MAPRSVTFRRTIEVKGTYDYSLISYQCLGTVGRVIVGKPGGLGERSPGYGNREGRMVMYREAARLFDYLNSDEFVQKKVLPFPQDPSEKESSGTVTSREMNQKTNPLSYQQVRVTQ